MNKSEDIEIKEELLEKEIDIEKEKEKEKDTGKEK